MPYPPSFNRTAAKIIDPSRGASTWAFGSHRWKINIGIFTRKAIINIIVKLILKQVTVEKSILKLGLIIKIPINNGREAVIVYKIRYNPAWRRSGWFPSLVIIINVGIKTISNII